MEGGGGGRGEGGGGGEGEGGEEGGGRRKGGEGGGGGGRGKGEGVRGEGGGDTKIGSRRAQRAPFSAAPECQRPERASRIAAQVAGPEPRRVAVMLGHRGFDRQRQRLFSEGAVRATFDTRQQPPGPHRIRGPPAGPASRPPRPGSLALPPVWGWWLRLGLDFGDAAVDGRAAHDRCGRRPPPRRRRRGDGLPGRRGDRRRGATPTSGRPGHQNDRSGMLQATPRHDATMGPAAHTRARPSRARAPWRRWRTRRSRPRRRPRSRAETSVVRVAAIRPAEAQEHALLPPGGDR